MDTQRSCDNCLFCHYVDEHNGYCTWGRYGKVPTALKGKIPDDMAPIDRHNPFIDCRTWNAIQPVVSLECE